MHSTHGKFLELFLKALQTTEGIRIEGEPKRTIDYGVLHGAFNIEPITEDTLRDDGIDGSGCKVVTAFLQLI